MEKHRAEGVLEGFENFIEQVKGFGVNNRAKVSEIENEMENINQRLEQREKEIAQMREQFEMQERGEADAFAGLDDEAKKLL